MFQKGKVCKMKNLEREQELERLIYEKANTYSEKKWLRLKRTFFVLSGVIYILSIYHGLKSDKIDIDIGYWLSWLGIAPVLAGFILLISYGVLCYIITNSMEEEKEIAELKGKLIERKYFINNKDE
jgi:predicted membrane channel-forming protein YqfA (hemolysin III family)